MMNHPSLFAPLWRTVVSAYQSQRHRRLLEALWLQERWFDAPHQLAAAKLLHDHLRDGGLDNVRLAPYAADGRTRYQDWTTRLAWDCPAARLTVAGSDLMLADRAACPTSLVAWSAPLGDERNPVRAGVVCWDLLDAPPPGDVTGKFVLSSRPAKQVKDRLAGMKPLAIISDFALRGNGYDQNSTQWVNAWADGSDGWYFTAADRPMTGFVLSASMGRQLRALLHADPQLELEAFCSARLYEGRGHCVTAVLKGEDPSREVWLYGHGCEQGAADNCSGVSAMAEAMLLLSGLVASGRLPRPRYSIRMLMTEECLGMLAFVTQHDHLRQKALVGLNVDAVGDRSGPAKPFNLKFGPYASPTVGWAICGLLGELAMRHYGEEYALHTSYFTPSADDMIGDPTCGIPTMWLGHGNDACGYHSSADTPDICDEVSLAANTQLAAAWAYAMASLDQSAAAEMILPIGQWLDRHVICAGGDAERLSRWAAAGVFRDMRRWGVFPSTYEPAATRYALADEPPLDDLPVFGPRFSRRTWGTCMLNNLPPHRRIGSSPWRPTQNAALYWTNAKRPLAAVERLVMAETGSLPAGGLAPLFKLLCDCGVVHVVPPSIPSAADINVGSLPWRQIEPSPK